MERRVVITGMGVLTPIANDLENYWHSLMNGVSGIGPVTRFDTTEYSTRIAGEVKNFNSEGIIPRKELRHLDLFSQYALYVADKAVKHCGIDMECENPFRVGVIFGSGIGGLATMFNQHRVLESHGPRRVSPYIIPMLIIDIAAGHISIRYGAKGPNYAPVSACASSSHAIGLSIDTIKLGDADVIITGGSEAPITQLALSGFGNMRALSRRNDEPTKASRPFDCDRDGFVLAEGAGAIVLEELEHAEKRGAPIFAELTRAGFTSDASHITAPDPEGTSAAQAMRYVLNHAKANPEEVDYINCHCPSTPAGDKAETKAIKSVFGEHFNNLPVSSTKSMTGHLLGAAGVIELIATVFSINNGAIPPTINVENQDPECDLDCVPNQPREHRINFAISNSFGFGGHNSVLGIKRFEG